MLLDKHLIVHEERHSKQQGDNPKEWWQRYCVDASFRFYQELQAYQDQYKSAKKVGKDREVLNKYLMRMAKDLSGEMYGTLCTTSEAMKAIKEEKLYTFDL